MKRILKFVTALIVSTAFIGNFASATPCSGEILNTGPVSDNVIKCEVVNNVTIECDNTLYLLTVNDQDATSGDGNVTRNTSTGDVVSGDAANINLTSSDVNIDSLCAIPLSVAPGGGAIVPAESTPEQPGGGEGAAPAMLPNTASASIAPLAIASLAASAFVVATSRLAVAAYRRVSNK